MLKKLGKDLLGYVRRVKGSLQSHASAFLFFRTVLTVARMAWCEAKLSGLCTDSAGQTSGRHWMFAFLDHHMISENEQLIAIKELPQYLEQRDRRRLALPTIYRWINSGLCGIRLEVIYLAGRSHTSVEALRRFDEAVTSAKLGAVRKIMPTATQVARAHERAKRKLAT